MDELRSSSGEPSPSTPLSFLQAAIDAAGAVGFVHVGDRFDDDLRYVTRFDGPDRDYAFVFTPSPGPGGTATVCAPRGFVDRAERSFVSGHADVDALERTVRTDSIDDPAGVRAAEALAAAGVESGTVLVPRHVPHDAAVYLESAGYDLRSTAAIETARTVKRPDEIECLRRVQRAAGGGVRRAAAILHESDPTDGVLYWQADPLSVGRLRRAIDEALAAAGVNSMGNTTVAVGPSSADVRRSDPIESGATVRVGVAPRGPAGYYGNLTRTFVVDGDGGWERRASVAVEAARRVVFDHLEPGVVASAVHDAAIAEVAAYGFPVGDVDANGDGVGGVQITQPAGHGVGMSRREAPRFTADSELAAHTVLAIELGVSDPDHGGVTLGDVVAISASEPGYDLLATYPCSLTPIVEG
ncbi:MAG: M24 family metallopeptidase [Halobacteriota archaeon]